MNMNDQFLLLLCVGGAVALLGYLVGRVILDRGTEGKIRTRLAGGESQNRVVAPTGGRMRQLFQRLGYKASKPFMPSDATRQFVIRRGLARAGIYTGTSVRMVIGAKFILMAAGVVLGWTIGLWTDELLLGVSLGGILGYLTTMIWLKVKTANNQRELTNGLADALDLMVVCIEAGLTVDGAMQRIGHDLTLAHPAISREFGIAHMETRVGLARTDALRNMGERTGNRAIQSLASMLIQTERFGTSIADALRVHSESLRAARQMAAEEAAGKASVKMSFPLVLCIFPATFIVLAGPTVIQLMQSSLFN